LFLATVCTTTIVGAGHYLSFTSEFGTREIVVGWDLIWPGLGYCAAVLGILGAHEMGHYVMCRRYNVDATLPFFLPFPPVLSLFGTLGAVIKIREPFPTRTALFDMGVAGPIAGFVVLVPLLFWGMGLSNVMAVPPDMDGWTLGEPLLFRLAAYIHFGHVPDGYSVNIHPVVFASWFGMLATAFNLLPFGQLDGGHLTYAILRERSRFFSLATVAAAVAMCFVSLNWLLMTLVMLAMLVLLGPRHPRVLDEQEPLDARRYAVAALAVLILIVCFTPVPLDPL